MVSTGTGYRHRPEQTANRALILPILLFFYCLSTPSISSPTGPDAFELVFHLVFFLSFFNFSFQVIEVFDLCQPLLSFFRFNVLALDAKDISCLLYVLAVVIVNVTFLIVDHVSILHVQFWFEIVGLSVVSVLVAQQSSFQIPFAQLHVVSTISPSEFGASLLLSVTIWFGFFLLYVDATKVVWFAQSLPCPYSLIKSR